MRSTSALRRKASSSAFSSSAIHPSRRIAFAMLLIRTRSQTPGARLRASRTMYLRHRSSAQSESPQLAQQREERLALPGIERRERLLGDGERIRRGLFRQLLAGARQADQETAAVFGIGAGLGQAAGGEPVDHALDGGDIHRRQPAELVLRARSGLGEFCQCRPLRRRQGDSDFLGEDGGVALPYLAQDEADLLVKDIGRPRRLKTPFRRNTPGHLPTLPLL